MADVAELDIVIAMTPEFTERTLSPALRERLATFGRVRVSPSPADHHTPAARELLAGADVVITGTGTALLDDATLAAAPRLEAIVHAAGSLRPVVTAAAFERGIRLSSQAGANALPVAEYTLAMILLELKGVRLAEQVYRAERDEVDVDKLLAVNGNYGRRVGIVSASAIGRRVIELLRPFDVDTVVYDPYLSAEAAAELGAARMDLRSLLSTSDLVSLHAPLLPETRGMIGTTELAALRDGAILVNTARGALVDQQALIRELVEGRIRAVIDVTDPEVPEPGSPLWSLDNVVLTPHVAGSRGLELHRIGERAVAEVGRLARGEPLAHEVTREAYAINA
ncbi:2-hydroxyacid dehydrogenase [Amycolatopsis acidiphila]|nr:2-hydroxyacid dehydrogenase [Amycolatopsis acidiphila]